MGLFDIFKKKDDKAPAPGVKQGTGGLSDSMKKLFSQPAPEPIYSNDFREEKKAISEYKTTLKDELVKRQESPVTPPAPATPAPATVAAGQAGLPPDPPAPKHAGFKLNKEAILGKINEAKAWHAPNILKTNLIEGDSLAVADWGSKKRALAAAFIIPLLLSMAAYAALLLWERQARIEAKSLSGRLSELNIEIAAAEKASLEVDRFQGKLKALARLLDGHKHWTSFFAFLERTVMPETAIIGGFSGDAAGTYSFKMVSPDYASIPEQLMVFRRDPWVKSAAVKDAAAGTETKGALPGQAAVSYTLLIELDPALFLEKHE